MGAAPAARRLRVLCLHSFRTSGKIFEEQVRRFGAGLGKRVQQFGLRSPVPRQELSEAGHEPARALQSMSSNQRFPLESLGIIRSPLSITRPSPYCRKLQLQRAQLTEALGDLVELVSAGCNESSCPQSALSPQPRCLYGKDQQSTGDLSSSALSCLGCWPSFHKRPTLM